MAGVGTQLDLDVEVYGIALISKSTHIVPTLSQYPKIKKGSLCRVG